MKLKLDENLGASFAATLRAAEHDVSTVSDEQLDGAPDVEVLRAASADRRCLITLDLEFGNPLRFPPSEFAGIAVLRLPRRAAAQHLQKLAKILTRALTRHEVAGRLWIVEIDRVREYPHG